MSIPQAKQGYLSPQELWAEIEREAEQELENEPLLSTYIYSTVTYHKTFADVLMFHLASKLGGPTLADRNWMKIIADPFKDDPQIVESACIDLQVISERDPACTGYMTSLLYFKGYQALQCYRVANWYWKKGRKFLALFIQSRISEVFSVDIHPAAQIGTGIFVDHAHGIVIGETVVVEDNVSMLHAVTLGGTGNEKGDRHPKVRRGVLIGAGAKVLGNIEINEGAIIAASSVVLEDVPAHVTVAGIPARITGHARTENPALDMDHRLAVEGFDPCTICDAAPKK